MSHSSSFFNLAPDVLETQAIEAVQQSITRMRAKGISTITVRDNVIYEESSNGALQKLNIIELDNVLTQSIETNSIYTPTVVDNHQPKLVVFAGPNASGKSTITMNYQQSPDFPNNYINPDEIAKTIDDDQDKVAYQAVFIAEEMREQLLKSGASIAFETVMSHPSKIDFIKQAKDKRYYVMLIFVATIDPKINVARVRKRVEDGGHNVPVDKIINRYHRVMDLLSAAIFHVDKAILIDNTYMPILTAIIENNNVVYRARSIPDWANKALVNAQ